MNLLRYLRQECIATDLEFTPEVPAEDESPAQSARRIERDQEAALLAMSHLLDRSGEIRNLTKFHKDLVHRERKATTAIAPGIAIPHVRSMQARSFIMGLARVPAPGIPFDSLDGEPTRLFFLLASPPYEDKLYLLAYRDFAELVQQTWVVEALLDAQSPGDILNVLRGYITR